MAILVAVTDAAEGQAALERGVREARLRRTTLIVANLKLTPLDLSWLPEDLQPRVVERKPNVEVGDHVLAILEEFRDDIAMMVIGMRKRTPIGKAVLGSLAQRLLLDADVPIMAVKARRS